VIGDRRQTPDLNLDGYDLLVQAKFHGGIKSSRVTLQNGRWAVTPSWSTGPRGRSAALSETLVLGPLRPDAWTSATRDWSKSTRC
jgi:hypothetical protein